MGALTVKQRALLEVLRSDVCRGFDLAELSRRLDAPSEGLSRTAGSLIRRGLAIRFIGGVGPRQRVHYQAVVV